MSRETGWGQRCIEDPVVIERPQASLFDSLADSATTCDGCPINEGGTTAPLQEVEQRMEQLPRAALGRRVRIGQKFG